VFGRTADYFNLLNLNEFLETTMTQPVTVMKIELCDPTGKEGDPHWYGLRITEYDTDTEYRTDKKRITNIVERAYWWHRPITESIEDLLTYTQRCQREEEQKILEELK
jgi:hypothetical protein